MNDISIILTALILAWVVTRLSSRYSRKVNNPNQTPISSSVGVIEQKYREEGGSARKTYPAIVLQDYDGTCLNLRLTNWAVYEDLYEGDRIQVNHRDGQAMQIHVQQRGENYTAAQTVHSAPARFRRSYVSNTTLYRHTVYAEFVTEDGETLTLRPPTGWAPPRKNTRGTLSWHGEHLDFWSDEHDSH